MLLDWDVELCLQYCSSANVGLDLDWFSPPHRLLGLGLDLASASEGFGPFFGVGVLLLALCADPAQLRAWLQRGGGWVGRRCCWSDQLQQKDDKRSICHRKPRKGKKRRQASIIQKIPLHLLLPKLGPNALPEPMLLDDSVKLLGEEGVLIKAHFLIRY